MKDDNDQIIGTVKVTFAIRYGDCRLPKGTKPMTGRQVEHLLDRIKFLVGEAVPLHPVVTDENGVDDVTIDLDIDDTEWELTDAPCPVGNFDQILDEVGR